MAAKPPGEEKLKALLDGTPKIASPLSPYRFHLIMALVAVVILVGGYVFYHFQEQQVRQRIKSGLSIMAELKAAQIAEWRAERLVDANVLVGSPFFTEGVEKYLAAPTDAEAKEKLLARLAVIEKAYPYQDILLTGVDGEVLLSLNDNVHRLSDMTLAQLAIAIKEHKAVITDFHYPPDGDSPHLDVVAPLFPWGQDSPQAIGAVIFSIDPAQYLYPLLQSSPMPSQTAESLLVERDGDQVLFLNELRHQKDTAFKLRIPLSQQEVPAVMAVTGKEGIVEGKDYRGVEVLAVLKHIPDSPWYMVTKIDTSEALAAWSSRAGMIIAFFAGLLVAALAGIGFIWQRRRRLEYQALYQTEEALRLSMERYRILFDTNINGLCVIDETMKVLLVNKAAARIFGFESAEEVVGVNPFDFIPPQERERVLGTITKDMFEKDKKQINEFQLMNNAGKEVWVSAVGAVIEYQGKPAGLISFSDITERKARKEEYRAIISTTIDGFWQADMQGRFLDVNEAYCHLTGFSREELLNMSITDIEAIEKPEETARRIQRIGETGSDRFESRHRRKDGKVVDVEISVNYLPTDGGRLFVFIRDITERKQAEEKIRLSERHLQGLLELHRMADNTQKAILNHTLEASLKASQSEFAFIGIMSPDEAVMTIHSWSEGAMEQCAIREKPVHFPIADAGLWGEVVRQRRPIMVNDYDASSEYKKGYPEGHVPIKRFLSIPVFGANKIVAVAAVANKMSEYDEADVNALASLLHEMWSLIERKQAEEALQEEQRKLKEAQALGKIGNWEYDVDSQRIIWSDEVYVLYDRDPALGPPTAEEEAKYYSADQAKILGDYAARSIENGEEFRYDLEAILPSGKRVSFVGSMRPIINENGRVIKLFGTVQDITERKRAEEALRESETKHRALFETMTQGVVYQNAEGYIFSANTAAEQILGLTLDQMQGRTSKDPRWKAIHEDSSDFPGDTHPAMIALKTGKEIRNAIMGVFNPDKNEYVWINIYATPQFKPGEKEPHQVYTIFADITERKKAEEEKKQLELKAQIASRLASVGEMAAGVAHEINNPLTAVTGYAQLLMDREDIPPDMRSDLEAINDGAQRVAGIVQRLLAFSRQTRPERKLVDINELIESTLILRAYHLKVNNIEVTTKFAADLLETVIDPGQIQQVLLNLIVNAETAMRLAHGKGKLTITTEKSHDTIKICIKDDGPGIKPEVMDWIFDPFFTTREVGQGTGLGLSLCYGIVMEHKGRIYVESQPGEGANFIVELPVITEAKPLKPAESDVKKSKRKVRGRILAVDDERVVRDVVNRVLTSEGHKVDTVDNAAEALKKIEGKRYNLILVDIKMPGMNGVELYKRIQKIDKSLARRVVFMTGDIMSADTEKFLAETKVAHIEKPFDAEQLSGAVKRVLSGG